MAYAKEKGFVYIVGITAALAGLLFGLDTGIISGALPFIKLTFNLTVDESEAIVTAALIGAILGTILSGFITRRFGRHFAIWMSAFIFCIGALLCALSVNLPMLVISRVILGIAIGLTSFTAPLYLSEISPKHLRGGMIATFQLMITVGILVSYVADTLLTPSGSWRWMFGVTFFPAFVLFLAVLILPKSPRWLVLVGKKEEARIVLGKVRNPDEINAELAEIESTINKNHSLKEVLQSRTFLKVLFLGIILQAIQQFSGINTVIYYAPSIFKLAGFATSIQQMWATVLVGTVNMLTTIIAIMYVDKWGRKPILYFGLCTTTISLGLLGYLFHLGIGSVVSQYLAVALVLSFIFGFAVSLGPIMWILCAEIFPLKGRDVGVGVTTATNWVCNAIIGGTFLSLITDFGPASTFGLFSLIGLLSLLFVIGFVPETKDVSLERIEANLLAHKKLRDLGAY
jgi:SP family galactose:H+ symporter-like MFS transporter